MKLSCSKCNNLHLIVDDKFLRSQVSGVKHRTVFRRGCVFTRIQTRGFILLPTFHKLEIHNFLSKNRILCVHKFLHVNVLVDPLLHFRFLFWLNVVNLVLREWRHKALIVIMAHEDFCQLMLSWIWTYQYYVSQMRVVWETHLTHNLKFFLYDTYRNKTISLITNNTNADAKTSINRVYLEWVSVYPELVV